MKTVFCFCFFLFAFCAAAQEIKLWFNKTKILIGEPIEMKIDALIAQGQISYLFALDTLPHFEVLQKSKLDSSAEGNNMRLQQIFTITSWDSGKWTLPSLITNGQGSKPVAIYVGYTSPWDPQQDYHDIKTIVPVDNPDRTTWWWYVVGAIVLIALFLLFFPAGKKEQTPSAIDSKAYQKAMQQLAKLQSDNLINSNAKQYYTELVSIFRNYLKGAKGIQSFSKTTDDLSIQLQALNMPAAAYNSLLQTLRLSDLVKFAQYKPDTQTGNESFSTIKESITTIEHRNAV